MADRLSQFVVEDIGSVLPNARLSQFVVETLTQETSQTARLSQFVVENIGQGTTQHARLSQFVLEYLVIDCSSPSYVPPAPTGELVLTATPGNVGEQWIDLAWNDLGLSYTLKRGTTSGMYPDTLLSGSGAVTYHDTAVSFFVQYYYLLTGVDACGSLTTSNESTASPGCDLPVRPLRLHATANQTGGVDLLWNAAAGASTYQVWRGTTIGGETLLVSGLTATSYTDASVPAGATVYYVVYAFNACGLSMASNEVSASGGCCTRYEPIDTECADYVPGPGCDTDYTVGTTPTTVYTTEGCS